MMWTKGHGFDASRVCLCLRGFIMSMIAPWTDTPVEISLLSKTEEMSLELGTLRSRSILMGHDNHDTMSFVFHIFALTSLNSTFSLSMSVFCAGHSMPNPSV